MVQCEFLILDETKTCVGCRGWFCLALGNRLKLSNTSDCSDNPLECTRYYQAHPELVDEDLTASEKAEKVAAVKVKPKKKRKAKPKKKVKAKVAVTTTPPSSPNCPYMGPVPAGEYGCCGYWCLARDEPLRSVKRCKDLPSWLECRRRIDAERAGVKHASP